jgi:hypothetical protein
LQHALDLAWAQRCYKVMLAHGRKDEGVCPLLRGVGFQRGVKTGFIAYPPRSRGTDEDDELGRTHTHPPPVSCSTTTLPEPLVAHEVGQVVAEEDVFGTFFTYVAKTAPEQWKSLVLIHGTPSKEETAESNARYYITAWVDFAEEQGYILLVPAFNQEDFSSSLGDHALGGYRGLFGREINADAWVLRLVKAYQEAYGTSGAPFYLYGHSAGDNLWDAS